MLQSRNVYGVLALAMLGCASAPAPQPAPSPQTEPAPAESARDAPPTPPAPEPQPTPEPTEPAAPESPVVLRVSYGNLGTAAGSEWTVHADGAIQGKICGEPRERQITTDEVADLRAAIERCRLCKLPEHDPSGANADKQIYRVEASWPGLQCTRDVSMHSSWHYDKRAQRCHESVEAVLHATVGICPGELEP